ncbi:unnamed protein product [Notodromas monacha]|uniref:Large ribosomal subunit protein uL10m n=1 Tax=Notodromas monacha TaxID=399045 RepID=A0A7R9GAH1_9CRUS|nr:unnamed protein product [Notodromas monacha]CAG0915340.1 unnamed protein product [Notodromas monacha]
MSSWLLRPLSTVSVQVRNYGRFGRKPRITKPRPSHTYRALVEHIVQPKYVDFVKLLPPNETCELNAHYQSVTAAVETNVTKYETLLAREALMKFQSSQLTLIFHRNKMEGWDYFDASLALHKCGIKVEAIGKKILQIALDGTKYSNILPIFTGHQLIGFGMEKSDPKSVKAIFKALRRTPGVVLMAGILQDRIMSTSQLKSYSEWGNKHAELVSTLATVGGADLSRLDAVKSPRVTTQLLYFILKIFILFPKDRTNLDHVSRIENNIPCQVLQDATHKLFLTQCPAVRTTRVQAVCCVALLDGFRQILVACVSVLKSQFATFDASMFPPMLVSVPHPETLTTVPVLKEVDVDKLIVLTFVLSMVAAVFSLMIPMFFGSDPTKDDGYKGYTKPNPLIFCSAFSQILVACVSVLKSQFATFDASMFPPMLVSVPHPETLTTVPVLKEVDVDKLIVLTFVLSMVAAVFSLMIPMFFGSDPTKDDGLFPIDDPDFAMSRISKLAETCKDFWTQLPAVRTIFGEISDPVQIVMIPNNDASIRARCSKPVLDVASVPDTITGFIIIIIIVGCPIFFIRWAFGLFNFDRIPSYFQCRVAHDEGKVRHDEGVARGCDYCESLPFVIDIDIRVTRGLLLLFLLL